MPRERSSKQVRVDAIKMGVRKAQSGCLECMEGYFELAKQYGATDNEIQLALEKATGTMGKGLSRREVIKIAVASSLALATVGMLTNTAQAYSYYWGTDSNSGNCCSMPYNLYIGRMGYGNEQNGDPSFFNRSAAQQAGFDNTYGFWGIQGPGLAPSGMSPYAWGQRQATNAHNAWLAGPNASYIGGYTVFGDVEPEMGGWTVNGNYSNQQQLINGFLYQLYSLMPGNPAPGLYISSSNWKSLLGTGFVPNLSFVLWLAGCACSVCGPCSSCNTLTSVENYWQSTIQYVAMGNMAPALWQYWIDNGTGKAPCYTCGDFNVAVQNPGGRSFSPVNAVTTFTQKC